MTTNTTKTPTWKRVLALVGVGLLVVLYLLALIFALIGTPWARNMLMIALISTFFIPITIYLILMFSRLSHRGETQYIEVPTDPELAGKDNDSKTE